MSRQFRPAGDSSDEDDDWGGFSYCGRDEFNDAPEPKPRVNHFTSKLPALSKMITEQQQQEELTSAVIDGNLERVREIVEQGISLEGKRGGWSPLLSACNHGHPEIVEYLLSKGANPQAHKELFTPLMACCVHVSSERKSVECIDLLLRYDADINTQDKYKMSAVMFACTNKCEAIIDRLLTVPGISINDEDKDKWTALFHAVNTGSVQIVVKLVDAGADINLQDVNGKTAGDLAVLKEFFDIAGILGYNLEENVNKEPIKEPVMSAIDKFLQQLPDSSGNGGFTEDIHHFFYGLELEHVLTQINTIPDLQTFLVMNDNDLKLIGCKLTPVRKKILQQGIHQFHLKPWRTQSMHSLAEDKQFGLHEGTLVISNMLKHLCVLHSSLQYLQNRVLSHGESGENCKESAQQLIDLMVSIYKETNQLKLKLLKLLQQISQVKQLRCVQADYIPPEKKTTNTININTGVCCAVTFGVLYCLYNCYKF